MAAQASLFSSCTGLNEESIVTINGTDYPNTFSHEIYGKVTNVGASVDNLHPGDHDFDLTFDKSATFQRTASNLVQKADESDLPEDLATLPMSYATAIHGLGNLEEDSIVLKLMVPDPVGSPH